MPDFNPHLIHRAIARNQEALGVIYDTLYHSVFRYVYYRVLDQDTAEDLAAEVFVRMVEHIRTFEPRGHPILAWLFTIARNLITDHYRLKGKADCLPLEESLVRWLISMANSNPLLQMNGL